LEEFLENPRDNRLPIPKGLNRCGGVEIDAADSVKPLAGLGGGFTRVPKVLFRLGHRTSGKISIGAARTRRATLAGLSAARCKTQGSLASSATLGWIIKRLRRSYEPLAWVAEVHNMLSTDSRLLGVWVPRGNL